MTVMCNVCIDRSKGLQGPRLERKEKNRLRLAIGSSNAIHSAQKKSSRPSPRPLHPQIVFITPLSTRIQSSTRETTMEFWNTLFGTASVRKDYGVEYWKEPERTGWLFKQGEQDTPRTRREPASKKEFSDACTFCFSPSNPHRRAYQDVETPLVRHEARQNLLVPS